MIDDYIDAKLFDGKFGRVTNDKSVWYADNSTDGVRLPADLGEIPDDFKAVLSPISKLKGGSRAMFKVLTQGNYWMGVLVSKRRIFCLAFGELS